MRRFVLHVDLDQFVAAVEILRRPELRGRPVVVGGGGDPTKRGVVSTASYEARAFGVRSGMPLRTALRRCPEAVFLPVDAAAYTKASGRVMAVLQTFPAVVEVAGWDEAFLAVETDDPRGLAEGIRAAVLERTGLSCSLGIGRNRLQAKIASGLAKPGGVVALTFRNWSEVMDARPTDSLWGVGPKTAHRLAALGIQTVGGLAGADEGELAGVFGPHTGPSLVALARGEGGGEVSAAPWVPRSRGREETFQEDLEDEAGIRDELGRLAARVADDLAGEDRPAVRVVVKVRFHPFVTRSHGVPLSPPSRDASALRAAALFALDRFDLDRPVRLLGVRADLAP